MINIIRPVFFLLASLLSISSLYAQLNNPEPSHQDTVYGIDLTGDGATLVSVSADGTVMVWNPRSGERMLTISESAGRIRDIDIDSAGTAILGGGDDGIVREWDIESGELLHEYSMPAAEGGTDGGEEGSVEGSAARTGVPTFFAVRYVLDDSAVIGMTGYSTVAWNRRTGELLYRNDELSGDAAFHPDGTTALTIQAFYATYEDGSQRAFASGMPVVWSIETGKVLFEGDAIDRRGVRAYSPDGSKLIVGMGWPPATFIYDAESLEVLYEVPEWDKILSVAAGPRGNYAYTGSKDGGTSRIDLAGGEIVGRLGGYRSRQE